MRVVAFDTRGSGCSDRPNRVSDYRLEQLAEDIGAVIVACTPRAPVHLVGHDWGSVKAWHAAAEPGLQQRIVSLTSISGPCLDAVPLWFGECLRKGLSGWRAIAGMWKSPIYMGVFQVPVVRTLLCRSGIVDLAIRAAERAETGNRPSDLPRWRARDNWHSVLIYRANLVPHLLHPTPRRAVVPVQVLAPQRDLFVSVASQTAVPAAVASDVQYQLLDGGHWAPVFDPAQIADRISTFVTTHTTKSDKEDSTS